VHDLQGEKKRQSEEAQSKPACRQKMPGLRCAGEYVCLLSNPPAETQSARQIISELPGEISQRGLGTMKDECFISIIFLTAAMYFMLEIAMIIAVVAIEFGNFLVYLGAVLFGVIICRAYLDRLKILLFDD
jgi:hypothetical protein